MADRRAVIVVDARIARRRTTGAARYVRELVGAIDAAAPDDLTLLVVNGPPGLPRRNALTTVGNLLIDLAWTHIALPLIALRHRAAAIHAPFNWGPAIASCPVVVTVHDLAWERVPETFPRFFRRYATLFTKLSVRRARGVIAVSRATATDLGELYATPAAKVRTIPNGVRPDAAPTSGPREPFILAVGEMEPRKRVLELVEAHRRYLAAAPSDPTPCRLVIVGAGGSQEQAVRAAAGPGVTLTGRIGDAELNDLYRRATLLVFPSSYEGFGLPVLEAMAHGCPALVAQNSSLIEICGEAGIPLRDPSIAGMSQALTSLLADREALRVRGEGSRAHAARFGWDRVAAATIAAYRETIRR